LAHVELRRDGSVPLVRLEPEGDVVAPDLAQTVEPRTEAERDRAARVPPVLADAEAEVLALADGRELRQLAAGQQQRHVRVAEAEGRQPGELGAQVESQLRAVRERVHGRERPQVVLAQRAVRNGGEGPRELLDPLRADREPGRSGVAAPALEVPRALPQA